MNGDYKHALVFGASGLIGWSVVDQLLSQYPGPGHFKKVTAAIKRPANVKDFNWPHPTGEGQQLKLQLVCGINLLQGSVKDLADTLESSVSDIGTVTHVYYFGEFLSLSL
jgi:nucleoside-diphosphate-sugar epimerase